MENKSFVRFMIILAIGLSLWLFFPFLKSFFAALLLAIVISPVYRVVRQKVQTIRSVEPFSDVVSAGIVTLGLTLILFIPIAVFLSNLFNQPQNTIGMIRMLGDGIDTLSSRLPAFLSWLKDPMDNLLEIAKVHKDEILATLAAWFGSGVKSFMTMLAEMTMIVVFFFFLNWYGRSIALFFLPIIPLSRTMKREFLSHMMTTTAVVFYTFGGVMLAQGLAFGIFIAFFEGYNSLVLGFLTGFASIIPIVGTALIWVPVAINEYVHGHLFNAVVITVYSWAMMAFFIDNIVKLVILNFVNKTLSDGKNRMNEFVIFFAIVGGLATFGFWGFIFGPAIVAFTLTTLRMIRRTRAKRLR